MSEIRKNFFYSSILTSAGYIFPLLTYPYVSRVLGVTNIGICNFVDGIINYYVLFSLMGILAVGIREVAATKCDRTRLSKTFSSLLCLNAISTTIVLFLLVASIFAVPKLYEHKELMFIGIFKVLFNYLLIEWFYKGLEDFKYITICSLLTKTLYTISVFVFVRESSDYRVYYLLTMLMIAGSAIMNLLHSRKYVDFSFRDISFKPYLSAFLILGVYLLLTSMYSTFNIVYLGFVCGETEVGYYTTATKLHTIFLALFTAFTGVMMPRMSSLASQGLLGELKNLLHKSFHVLFVFSVPVVFFTVVFAPQIVHFIAGPGYENAVMPMRIVMPLILIIGYEQIAVIQVLMPLKKDRAIFINSCVGALFGLIVNVLLVGYLKSVGSSLVWVSSELIVLFMASYFLKKYINVSFPIRGLIKYFLCSLPCVVVLVAIEIFISNNFVCLVLGAVFAFLYYYFLYVVALKDKIVLSLFQQVFKRS